MKTPSRLLVLALIAGGTMFAQVRFSVGIGTGGYGPGYYPPPVYDQYVPQCPGPGYTWVDGYWAPQYGRNVWITGFWRPPVRGYYRAPRYLAPPRYYNSYRGYDRDWDRDRDYRRDYRGGDRGRHRGWGHNRD
ncbi:MAG TPA: YXWGXW repeat-containing protein [Paludibaculum sp.]|jgi:hypothetical protein